MTAPGRAYVQPRLVRQKSLKVTSLKFRDYFQILYFIAVCCLWQLPADVSQIYPVIRCEIEDDTEPPPSPPPPRQQKANSGQEVLIAQNTDSDSPSLSLQQRPLDLTCSPLCRSLSSRLFIRPVMFDLELEWTVGVRGGGRRAKRNLHFPSPTPLLIFDRWLPPHYKFPSLPSLLMPLKSKRAAIIFIKKVPSTRSPKLRLLCRLSNMKKSYYFSCYVTSLRSLCFDIVVLYMSLELVPFIYCLAHVFFVYLIVIANCRIKCQ